MAEGSAQGNTPASFEINDEDSSTGSEGSDADSDTPLDLPCTRRHEGPPQDGASLPSSENAPRPWRPWSGDSDSKSSASLDLTWKTQEASLAQDQKKMQYPMADASSHVPSESGKTLEHSHFTERRERLHRHEQAQRDEGDASSEAMKERHQQESNDKDSLSLAPKQLPHQSLVSTGDGVHSCRQCTYTTKYKRSMKRHLYQHTGERPFRCSECPKSFIQATHLKDHILTHTGERPFACAHCSASFSQKGNLNSHVRTHTGERPFSCVHCPASFSLKGNLDRHIRSMHKRLRPFSCVHCSASFSRNESLISHMSKCGANKKP